MRVSTMLVNNIYEYMYRYGMKQGNTILEITKDTLTKFRKAKLKYQSNMGETISNDEFLQELLK